MSHIVKSDLTTTMMQHYFGQVGTEFKIVLLKGIHPAQGCDGKYNSSHTYSTLSGTFLYMLYKEK